jgi:hypothetical protein
MPRPTSTLLVVMLVAAAVAASGNADQLVIRDTDAQQLDQPFFGLSLQRQWSVAQSNADISSEQHLRDLHVNTFGRVFVEFANGSDELDWQPDEIAKVVIYSNVSELLDIFEVEPVDEAGIVLRVKNEDAYVHGLVFSKIVLHEQAALRQLELGGSADIVVTDGVFESAASTDDKSSVSLTIGGSGDIDVGLSSEFAVDTLDLFIHGSGDIRFNAPTLRVSDALQLSVSGSGDIVVASESMELAYQSVSVSGSGDIVVDVNSENGSKCSKESIRISGSGDVNTASVACNTVEIDLTGSGDVKFQAVDRLSASVVGSGELTYVNVLPKDVDLSGPYSRRHLRSLLNHGKLSQKHRYCSDAATRYRSGDLARVVTVRIVASNNTGHPTLHIVEYDPSDWWMSGTFGGGLVSLAAVGSMDIGVFILALSAGAVAGVAVYTLVRRRRRQGYAVLA